MVVKEPKGGVLYDLISLPNGKLIGTGAAIASETARKDLARFQDMVIVCLSKDGEHLWTKTYGDLGRYGFKAMDMSSDGGLWVISELGFSSGSPSDVYLAKLTLTDIEINF